MNVLIRVSIISSKTGGTPGETDAYDRETTIDRIRQSLDELVSEHVPQGQISTVRVKVRKPSGALRRMMRGESGIRTTTLEFRIGLGKFTDMDRVDVIRICQEAVPELVTTNVPADHLCSLVVALKNDT